MLFVFRQDQILHWAEDKNRFCCNTLNMTPLHKSIHHHNRGTSWIVSTTKCTPRSALTFLPKYHSKNCPIFPSRYSSACHTRYFHTNPTHFQQAETSFHHNDHDDLASIDAASNILPDAYFQQEIFKSHNTRKLHQLGSDTGALKREIFLDAIELDLRKLNFDKNSEQTAQILDEYIPLRGISSYGLLHAMRTFRDAGMSQKGWEYFLQMESMGAPPSLHHLPIVIEIVKTAIHTNDEDSFVWAMTMYATRFPEDPVLWMTILDHASRLNSFRVNGVLVKMVQRFYSSFTKSNAWKVKVANLMSRTNHISTQHAIQRTIQTPSEFENEMQLFHAMQDYMRVGDFDKALSVFNSAMGAWKRMGAQAYEMHVNTVTQAVQCAIKAQNSSQAHYYLQYFFPKEFGTAPGGSKPLFKGDGGRLDLPLVVSGMEVLTHHGDFSGAFNLFKECPPSPLSVDQYMRCLLRANKNDDVVRVFKTYFRPFKVDGMTPHLRHTATLVRSLKDVEGSENQVLQLYDSLYSKEIQGGLYQGDALGESAAAFFTYFLPRLKNPEVYGRAQSLILQNIERTRVIFTHAPFFFHEWMGEEQLPALTALLEETVEQIGSNPNYASHENKRLMTKLSHIMFFQLQTRMQNFDELMQIVDRYYHDRVDEVANACTTIVHACMHNAKVNPSTARQMQAGALQVFKFLNKKNIKVPRKMLVPQIELFLSIEEWNAALKFTQICARDDDLSKLDNFSRDKLVQLLRVMEKKCDKFEQRLAAKTIRLGLSMHEKTELKRI
uniref:Uncharacterized protein n=1 Tax=Percolomonas cosmopolitus TaxID=63605 RepID=A0A7S1PHY1_9EUKA|mmetsp:Transcript_6520/g.24483  ORF Transcript_6520/g.24483 Transcript_6520/m.24483 type:complete len:778 (+) Transcript_6520:1734-4067(+)